MFGLGFILAAIGAYLIDSAVQNRHPIETIKEIIQDPANIGTILTETKGTFESPDDVAAGASSAGLATLLNEPLGAGGTSSPSSAPAATGKGKSGVSKNESSNKWDIVKPPPPNSLQLVTVKAAGHSFQVAKSAANQFVGFVNALAAEGYKITSIGGYDSRNIAGTSTPSLHSLGLAIDINPAQNPVSYGKVKTNLPANVAALAKKYGLVWGGSSQFHKHDAMHFSIPTAGYSY